jgi:hypothetical protein
MAIQYRAAGDAYVGTLAEFMASKRKFRKGSILIPTDSNQIRFATGNKKFSEEISFAAGALGKAANVAAFGAVTALPAVAGVFADLAAARTAVEAQRSAKEARLVAIEGKLNAVITALVNAGLMNSPA